MSATERASIAFQGEPGAYSHQACAETYPEMEPLPCPSFEDAIAAVRNGDARLAMLPIENSTYGRVADIQTTTPSLEDIFLDITGTTPADAERVNAEADT